MDRQDIIVEEEDYRELIKWALLRNSVFANAIASNKDVIIDTITNKAKYRIKKGDVNENDFLDLFHLFLDKEQCSATDKECIYFGHLAEVWRPIAEGPII